jgi:hypothetical protein
LYGDTEGKQMLDALRQWAAAAALWQEGASQQQPAQEEPDVSDITSDDFKMYLDDEAIDSLADLLAWNKEGEGEEQHKPSASELRIQLKAKRKDVSSAILKIRKRTKK